MRTLEEVSFERKLPYRRLNSIGHLLGCCCEVCWPLIERAIQNYLPGFLPGEPEDPRIVELEEINRVQREEIRHLRTELARRPAQSPTETRGLDVDPR
jgi:hypothetical protein